MIIRNFDLYFLVLRIYWGYVEITGHIQSNFYFDVHSFSESWLNQMSWPEIELFKLVLKFILTFCYSPSVLSSKERWLLHFFKSNFNQKSIFTKIYFWGGFKKSGKYGPLTLSNPFCTIIIVVMVVFISLSFIYQLRFMSFTVIRFKAWNPLCHLNVTPKRDHLEPN